MRMKFFVSLVLLTVSAFAQSSPLTGDWTGVATVHGQHVPFRLHVGRHEAALLNGPDADAASSVQLDGVHLLATFADYNRTLDATLADGKLVGSFGTPTVRYKLTGAPAQAVSGSACPVTLAGSWEIATASAKGEAAWTMKITPEQTGIKAFIQRVDGDTGSLYGSCVPEGKGFSVSHLSAAGPALYLLAPQPDGTLSVSNLLTADKGLQQDLVARRPAAARAAALPAPTDPSQQTRMKNPAEPLAFSGTDLTGKMVTNADPRFHHKVVLVAVGGSWCPNCHDEAPVLESLYKKYKADGFEVVDLSFEEADQLKSPTRLKAFIQSAGITYPVLLAGDPDELNAKLPQADNLNCWPTSFLLDRTGKVREIHAGFSGPATGDAYTELRNKMDGQIKELLNESSVASR